MQNNIYEVLWSVRYFPQSCLKDWEKLFERSDGIIFDESFEKYKQLLLGKWKGKKKRRKAQNWASIEV